ncbi:synaptotagmin-5-like isoform X1 [Pelobates fuscus]|uniref:synaptotagmin-5-like isoform X1 n=1 Tax=Pelobates fuscus TaxID=191477 RepID=UPI002FE450FF
MMDSDYGMDESPEEQTTPRALCHSVVFFCSKGMIEGVVVFLFIWLLIQVLLNKQQEVHLQVLLGAGLALLCFSLLLGCAICWHRSRRRQSTLNIIGEDKDLAQQSVREQEQSELPGRSAAVTITLQYQDMDGDIIPKSGDVIPIQEALDSVPARSLHSRASLPSLYQLSTKTKRAIQRRSTVFSYGSQRGDRSRLMRVPHSYTEPTGLSGAKQKSPPRLNFTLHYSLQEETLTVIVTGLSNLPKKFHQKKDSWVKAYLMPGFIEPHIEQTEGLEGGQTFSFRRCSPGELGELNLRLAVFARDRNNMREGLFGEVLFPCAHLDCQSEGTSDRTEELSLSKSKLKKSLSTMDVPCPPTPNPKSLGQILILLQYQMLANRIKVMVQKAENLGKLTRIPGAADHFVSIRLIQEGELKDMKETRSVSGSSPVWNAPFLFEASPKAVQEQTLTLEFLVKQGRIYNRARILGRVLIGAGASGAGLAHWDEVCSTGPKECAHWHTLQPDVF